uniref:Zinc finger protein ZFP69B n=1 Tax=Cacopsylla melanoneura TaxID=428564 RepID=A0A8D9EY77_9HEMI
MPCLPSVTYTHLIFTQIHHPGFQENFSSPIITMTSHRTDREEDDNMVDDGERMIKIKQEEEEHASLSETSEPIDEREWKKKKIEQFKHKRRRKSKYVTSSRSQHDKWEKFRRRRHSTSGAENRRVKSEPESDWSSGDDWGRQNRRAVKSETEWSTRFGEGGRSAPTSDCEGWDESDVWDDSSDGLGEFKFEESVYPCRFCGEAFRTHDAQMRHYKSAHKTYEVSLLCYFCGHIAKNIHSLTSHLRGLHQLPRKTQKILCEICSVEVLHIVEHLRNSHSGLKFECSQCTRMFTRKCDLRMHIKRIHMKAQLEEKFVCKFCSKVFNFYWYMKRHERVHTGERPYKCKLCPMAFNHMVSLKNHLKKCCTMASYGQTMGQQPEQQQGGVHMQHAGFQAVEIGWKREGI